MSIISFLFFIFIIVMIAKSNNITLSSYSSALKIIRANFSNVSIPYSDYSVTLCRGDKSGENFLFAIKNNSSPFSLQDVENLYEKAEKLHIHNRILITDLPINNTTITPKKLKEYEIDIWNSTKLASISTPNTNTSTSTYNSSALKTSDTSDDNCYIEEDLDDPIQDGTFHTHSIFSIFNNKTEHL